MYKYESGSVNGSGRERPRCFWGDDEHVRSMIFALKESN